jgi:hypothetical protein
MATTTDETDKTPSVGIVGAGIAGLTAALRLAERGFKVAVYERNTYVGGLLSAHQHHDRGPHYYEHCFHMFLNWYHNFWNLIADIGLSRERDFEPRNAVYYLRRRTDEDDDPDPGILRNPNLPVNALANAVAGVVTPPDLFLTGYSLLDLVTQQFRPGYLLDQYSVNGFLQSRPYASEQSARLHSSLLIKVFAVPSYLTSASSYKSLIKYSLYAPDPMLWVMRGDAQTTLFAPLLDRLVRLGCDVRESTVVRDVHFQRHDVSSAYRVKLEFDPEKPVEQECYMPDLEQDPKGVAESGKPTELPKFVKVKISSEGKPATGLFKYHDYVILAVPHATLQRLIAPKSLGGEPERSPAELVIGEAEALRRATPLQPSPSTVFAASLPLVLKLKSEPMAALDVPFRRRLPNIPKEHVILQDSTYQLSFVDNSQLWPDGDGNTLLNLVASDFKELANFSAQDAIEAMLVELSNYIAFDLDDVDLDRIHFQTNLGDELFINEVGSEAYRPGPITNFPNLFVAGDFCDTPIDVVTVEAAVVSGLQAAQALQARALADCWFRAGDRQARPIDIELPGSYPEAQLALLRTVLTPWAYAAKAWSWVNEQVSPPTAHRIPMDPITTWSRMMVAPYEIGATWWRGALDMWAAALGLGRGHR